ncbi:MAG: hypothetical protein EXR98_09235 [Gemmataceae bacterium]|nr:hypothetical protein [Gemmataceae bacterium]
MVPLFRVKLGWLTAEQGGRKSPISGGRYTPTARFAGEQDQFSVVMEFHQSDGPIPTKGTLRLLFPDVIEIQRRIRPGVDLEIMEGGRIVANCVVESSDVGAAVGAAGS